MGDCQIFYGHDFSSGPRYRNAGRTPEDWAHKDSNLGPTDYESAALTD